MKKRRFWTDEETQKLADIYPDMPTFEVAKMFGRSHRAIYHKANAMGLHKSQSYYDSPHSGRIMPGSNIGGATKFTSGHKTWNKGLKGVTGYSETRFKQGDMPHNHQPVGTVRKNKDGCIEIKTAEPKAWTTKHKLIWEAEHGHVPKGMVIRYIDGNHDNCTMDNLELITRAENAALNKVHYNQWPAELKPSLRLVVKINRKASDLVEAA